MKDSKPATNITNTTNTTKKTVKPQKIAYPRFMNAIDTFIDEKDRGTVLTHESTIGDLMDALRDAHMSEARGQ